MNESTDPPETDAGATVSDVRESLNGIPADQVSDSVIVRKLEAAETYVASIAGRTASTMQIREAEIARAAIKVYGSDSALESKSGGDFSKSWDTDGLRGDLNSEWEEWKSLIRGGSMFEVY